MTLINPNIERMLQLKLDGMAEAMRDHQDVPDIDRLDFHDRLAMLLESEVTHRNNKSYRAYLRKAQLRYRACIEDVDCSAGRGLSRTELTQLAAGNWIRKSINLTITGATGTGKTWLACAIAHQACRQRRSALYRRVPELVAELDAARQKGRITSLMRRLTRLDLLVLDDWGLQDFTAQARRDLLEIVEMRDQRKSTLIASQIPTKLWHQAIGEPTIADAILDRIIHNAYHIALKGKSMRRTLVPPALAELGDIDR